MSEIEHKQEPTANSHASLADLVLMRDGEQPLSVTHVDQCDFCQTRLENLCSAGSELKDAMLFEAELPVPTSAWLAIEAQLRGRGVSESQPMNEQLEPAFVAAASQTGVLAKPSIWSSINTAIYSLAAAVMFTGLVSLYTSQGQQQTRIETQALHASIQSLMDNSRGLESVLQQVAVQNRTLTLPDESAIERLKWRLMLVDQRINESELSDEISYEQIKSLWGERVDALTQLNKLYYTNQVAVNDGEI